QMWQSRTSSAETISRTFKFARRALSSVLVLQDELPINRAAGSYIAGFANPPTGGIHEGLSRLHGKIASARPSIRPARPVQKFGRSKLDATTLALDAGLNLPIWEAVTCRRLINYGYATRLPTTRQIPR